MNLITIFAAASYANVRESNEAISTQPPEICCALHIRGYAEFKNM